MASRLIASKKLAISAGLSNQRARRVPPVSAWQYGCYRHVLPCLLFFVGELWSSWLQSVLTHQGSFKT